MIGTLNGRPLRLGDLLFAIKVKGQQALFDDMVRLSLLEQKAEELGLQVRDIELQQAVDAFRTEHGLLSAMDTLAWMEHQRMTLAEVERMARLRVLERLVTESVATDGAVAQFFQRHRSEYDRAEVSMIAASDRAAAERLQAQMVSGEATFEELVRRYSSGPPPSGQSGHLGIVYREDLPPALERVVFSATGRLAGDVQGPIDAEDKFYLLKVHRRWLGHLDDVVKKAIAATLVEEALDKMTKRSDVKLYFSERAPKEA
jgi:parvulin-like peptidyl-prolyl isomerase